MTKKQLENSRPIDVYIWSDKPCIKCAADHIYKKMLKESGSYKHKTTGKLRVPYKKEYYQSIL